MSPWPWPKGQAFAVGTQRGSSLPYTVHHPQPAHSIKRVETTPEGLQPSWVGTGLKSTVSCPVPAGRDRGLLPPQAEHLLTHVPSTSCLLLCFYSVISKRRSHRTRRTCWLCCQASENCVPAPISVCSLPLTESSDAHSTPADRSPASCDICLTTLHPSLWGYLVHEGFLAQLECSHHGQLFTTLGTARMNILSHRPLWEAQSNRPRSTVGIRVLVF